MNRVQQAFAEVRDEGRGALVIYLTGGFPNLAESGELFKAIDGAGADIIEVGLPFSDPIADGPTIQAASQQALSSGASVAGILEMLSGIKAEISAPLVIMGCYNPILAYGAEQFAQDAVAAGVRGVLIADLPPEESEDWCATAAASDLATVFLLAPTTKDERFDQIISRTTGFVYVLSRQGVTGVRDTIPAGVPDLVTRVKQHTETPVAVGFGVSNARQVASVCAVADGAIVGSAVVAAIAEQQTADRRLQVVAEVVSQLAGGCRAPGVSEAMEETT